MTMQRWEPFGEFRRMDEALNRLWRGWDLRQPFGLTEAWDVPLDIIDQDGDLVVKASLPEIEQDKVDVAVEEGVLTIKGETSSEKESRQDSYVLRERRTGSFFRAVRLPEAVDATKAKSSYANGVLTITFPKVQVKKAQKIKVETAKA